jgi:hypothetical protein
MNISSLRHSLSSALTLLLSLLAASLLGAAPRAQSCDSSVGGASGTGLQCSLPSISMNYMDLIVDQRKNSSVLSLGPVTDPTLPAMIEPLIASLNSAGVGIDSVLGGGGTVSWPSGAQVMRVHVGYSDTGVQGSGLSLDLVINSVYQSQVGLVDAQKYVDATPGEDPFGPGISWSLAEGLLKSSYGDGTAEPPASVTWVDSMGTRWSFDKEETIPSTLSAVPLPETVQRRSR